MRIKLVFAGCLLASQFQAQSRNRFYPADASAQARWSVGVRPMLEIGGIDGAGPAEFTRIVGAARQSNGVIVVADATSRELRAFDARGRFIKRLARRGSGPGELPGLDGLAMVGDTIIAIDGRRAIHVFSPVGDWLRSLVLPSVPGYVVNPAIGALNAFDAVQNLRREAAGEAGGVTQDSIWTARVSLRDTTVRVLAGLPLPPTFPTGAGNRYRYPLGFAPHSLGAIGVGRICLGFADRFAVTCVDSTGAARLVVRREVKPRPVSDSARRAYRFVTSGRRPDGSSRFEGSLREHRERIARETKFAATYPIFSQLVLSRTGELWVRHFATEDGFDQSRWRSNAAPSTWSVFDAEGKWLADCELPARFAPGDIGHDWVLGVSRDADDVERVTLLSLQRSGGARR